MRWRRRPRRQSAAAGDWPEIEARVRAAKAERQTLLVGQEPLVEAISALLFRHDPIGINFEHNTDEYDAEAETITLRLGEASDVVALNSIVHEEFLHWFGSTAGVAGRYEDISAELWDLTQPDD